VASAGVQDDQAAFVAFCESLPENVRSIVVAADRLIRSVNPQVVQILWPHQRTVGYGIGPKKMTAHYCYLAVYHDKHVNLGFNHGVELADPDGLLGGSGARFRNLRLSSHGDLDQPGVQQLLRDAADERRHATRSNQM
jgi:Domain of unknown function (DU1801)